MNLVELRATGDWLFSLELHPRINVLLVPDEARRWRLSQMCADIMQGKLAGLEGIIAVDTATFELEADAIEILGIPPDIETTIAAADLPGARSIEMPAKEAEPAPPPPSEHTDEPVANEALTEASERLHALRVRLDEARSGDDGGRADEEVSAARAALGQARDALDAAAAAVPPPVSEPAAATEDPRMAAAREHVAELEERLREAEGERRTHELALRALPAAVSETAIDAVEAALHKLAEAEASEATPSPEAQALADRWARLQQRRQAAVEASDDGGPAEHPARRELDEARVELTRAQHGARPLYVSPDAADELDRAHSAVADAEDRAFRRLAGPLAKRRLEAAKAAEAEILKRIGVSSYDAYLMQSSPGLVDSDAQEQLSRARRRLAEAEAAWEAVLAESRSPEHQNVEAELDGVRHRAAELLGRRPDDDSLEADLRSMLVAPDVDGLRADLGANLSRAGAPPADLATVHDVAATWLAEVRSGRAERAAILQVVSDLDRRVDELVRQVEQARLDLKNFESEAPAVDAADVAATNGAAADDAGDDAVGAEHEAATLAVAEAERALAQAEEKAAASHAIRQEILALESETQELEATMAQLEAAQTAAEAPSLAEVGPANDQPPETPLVTRVDVSGVGAKDAELYVLARIAAQRSVGDAGPLPLIINDAFADFPPPAAAPVLDLLTRMSGIVQVIYITGDEAIRTWGERLGPEEAAVFRFAPVAPAV